MSKTYKSNIKCGACVNTVSSVLDNNDKVKSWKVDLENPDRILDIDTDLNQEELNDLLGKVGYAVEEVKS